MFGMKKIKNVFAQGEKFGGAPQGGVSVGAKRNRNFGLDVTGAGRHDKNSVAEKDRFFHVVRDKKGGRAFLLPDSQQ